MKLFTSLAGLAILVALTACSGAKLDGGSNNQSQGTGSSGGSGTGTQTEIKDQPVQGTLAGKDFVAKSVDLQFSKAQNQWFLTFRSYESNCGVIHGSPPGKDAMFINVGAVQPKAGEATLGYADGHGASFQLGTGPTVADSESDPVKQGTFRLDTWSETAGETVTGAIKAENATSSVEGTFTATICAPNE